MKKLSSYFRNNKSFLLGSIITAFVILLVLVGIFACPYDPNEMDSALKLSGASFKHIMGCDNFGRDIFSRLIVGMKMTLFIAFGVVGIGVAIGIVIGAFTGYYGGIVDEVLMRFNDAVLAFPSILLALVFIAVLGSGTYQVMIALGVVFVPSFARIVRGEFLKCKDLDYVRSARLMGAGDFRIMFVHILPNILPVLLSSIVIGFNNAVLAEAGMSFLGIGVQPPDSSLGAMLSDAQSYFFSSPLYAFAPGAMIALMILGFSLLGDGIGKITSNQKASSLDTADENGMPPRSSVKVKGDASLANEEVLLKVTDLQIEIDDNVIPETVVYDFDLEVRKKDIIGIVGESGSGKTMSALAIAGLLSRKDMKKRGTILFDGTDMLNSPRSVIRQIQGNSIGMIFQEPMTSLNPVKTIGWQVEEALRIHTDFDEATRKDKAIRMLKNVELDNAEDIYNRYPHELSGGQRQRVMIAAALVTHPKLLIADEPTTALDVTVQAQIIDLLRRVNKYYGTAILFISHDLSLVRQLCKDVAVMKDGVVVEAGNCEEIFENPQDEYTKELVGAIPKFEKLR